jgi:hypothetical protein
MNHNLVIRSEDQQLTPQSSVMLSFVDLSLRLDLLRETTKSALTKRPITILSRSKAASSGNVVIGEPERGLNELYPLVHSAEAAVTSLLHGYALVENPSSHVSKPYFSLNTLIDCHYHRT